ncbi:MAG TPA: hypothetical protein VLD39_18100 [Gammaproteobacteria bacterium]|nr:hypothetical protein [Gammaproteobacteria bacterium]
MTSLWIVLAIALGIVILKRMRRGRADRSEPGAVDVEADLLRACRGDRKLAERLIAHELEHNTGLSRAGAALMALAKLRDDQR